MTTLHIVLLAVAGHGVCAVLAYWLLRWDWRSKAGLWTTQARAFAIFISAYGPAGLVTAIICRYLSVNGPDRPARW